MIPEYKGIPKASEHSQGELF